MFVIWANYSHILSRSIFFMSNIKRPHTHVLFNSYDLMLCLFGEEYNKYDGCLANMRVWDKAMSSIHFPHIVRDLSKRLVQLKRIERDKVRATGSESRWLSSCLHANHSKNMLMLSAQIWKSCVKFVNVSFRALLDYGNRIHAKIAFAEIKTHMSLGEWEPRSMESENMCSSAKIFIGKKLECQRKRDTKKRNAV